MSTDRTLRRAPAPMPITTVGQPTQLQGLARLLLRMREQGQLQLVHSAAARPAPTTQVTA